MTISRLPQSIALYYYWVLISRCNIHMTTGIWERNESFKFWCCCFSFQISGKYKISLFIILLNWVNCLEIQKVTINTSSVVLRTVIIFTIDRWTFCVDMQWQIWSLKWFPIWNFLCGQREITSLIYLRVHWLTLGTSKDMKDHAHYGKTSTVVAIFLFSR